MFDTSIILIVLGVLSWIVGKVSDWMFKRPKNPEYLELYFVSMPKWANVLCVRSSKNVIDKYSVYFQLGGTALVMIGLIMFFVGSQATCTLAVWMSLFSYFVIPTYLLRKWQKV